ncbi:hypothetical protein DASC09_040510 [Saccharomycopsis crataegensis]|uniref:Rho-GAP domain-containing protein n=1 Tax=Saccharomycopsis crataegensis TaxID=43959 RepID=A0AAV5QQA2_9ASCO|nr:hypothetical protein DASC09_040510 [Saccharomycopsis crataegensis]
MEYHDNRVIVSCGIHKSQGWARFQLDLPTVLFKLGLAITTHANDEGLFKKQGNQSKLRELSTLFDNPPYGKNLVITDSSFDVSEYCSLFIHKMFELPRPLIPFELTKQLCDVALANSEIMQKFGSLDISFSFTNESPVPEDLSFPTSISSEIGLPFTITAARRVALELQFGISMQLAELMFYTLNTKLATLPREQRDTLVWALNIFAYLVRSCEDQERAHEELQYLATVFRASILDDGNNVEIGRRAEVVFTMLLYGVGIIVPEIFPQVSKSVTLKNTPIILPNTSRKDKPTAININDYNLSTPTTGNNEPTVQIVEQRNPLIEVSNASPIQKSYPPDSEVPPASPSPYTTVPSTPVRGGRSKESSILQTSTNSARTQRSMEPEDLMMHDELLPEEFEELQEILEELKLNPNGRVPFKCGKPLLQHLALPPAKSAVLVRKGRIILDNR